MQVLNIFLVAFGLSVPLAPGQALDQPQTYSAARVSSADAGGSNRDSVRVEARSTVTVADLQGAGRIVRMWFTFWTAEPHYLKTTRLKMWWDGATVPAVDVPFGDFHALGHGVVRQVTSNLIMVEARPPEMNPHLPHKNAGGFTSLFPMPFGKGARIVLENRADHPISMLYFQIDYQRWPAPPSPLRFHALYSESRPEPYPGGAAGKRAVPNTTPELNHTVLDATGRGHFLGLVLSAEAFGAGWWEGDEMIWLDGEKAPSIRGTGTEDYFGAAWGFVREFNTPYHGLSYMDRPADAADWREGKYTAYRFHAVDPIPFTRSLRMSIERGHNNHRRDTRYATVAFWYQE